MKFGKQLENSRQEEWRDHYLDYNQLKEMIKALSAVVTESNPGDRVTCVSMQGVNQPTAILNGVELTYAAFVEKIESEMVRIDQFTNELVASLQERVCDLEVEVNDAVVGSKLEDAGRAALYQRADALGMEFLRLEKFVNLNLTGFHKILKKHDKHMPTKLRVLYASKLRAQSWISGDHSMIFVHLSHMMSQIRGDGAGSKQQEGAQQFVRKTTKYWVNTENITRVKYAVMKQLPVFQMTKLPGDSQLCNSVYLDNESMELYRGRLNKTAGAIALRLRWYNTATPEEVFVERKTHRDTWTGEESVKERFSLRADDVYPFLIGQYTLEDAVRDGRARGLSDTEIESMSQLFKEIYQQIDSKQLVPCVRTQYMRAAYQIPFDATVRVSLDTHLAMINENPMFGESTMEQGRWFRNPMLPTPPNEITHFPHAVLEVKLSLRDGEEPPQWVTELLRSGSCTEVHKFSKFLHGTCTLLPSKVTDIGVPYWVDDKTVQPSMQQSQNAIQEVLARASVGTVGSQSGQAFSMDPVAQHELGEPLLGESRGPQIMDTANNNRYAEAQEGCDICSFCPWGGHAPEVARKVPMKVEPKVFFANERTFLSWLHISVTLGSVGAVLLGFSHDQDNENNHGKKVVGIGLCFVGILFALYALCTFYWRARKIRLRLDGPFDDRVGPMLMCVTLVCLLSALAGWYIHKEIE